MSTSKQKVAPNRKRSVMDDINMGIYELAGQLAEYVTLLRNSQDGQSTDN